MDISSLKDIGLTENETTIYVSLLKLGISSASQIIQHTGLHRAVIYDVLSRLLEKGLISSAIIGRKKHFEATNPSRLIDILEEKKQSVKQLLPSLLELSSFSEGLEVKTYKGKEGLKTVFEDLLRAKPSEWLSLSSGGKTYELLPFYLTQFQKKRIKSSIKLKALLIDSIQSRKRANMFEKDSLTVVKLLPKEFRTPSVMNIYDDKVVLYNVNSDNIFAVVIQNKTLANSFKEYFNYLWNQSKKV